MDVLKVYHTLILSLRKNDIGVDIFTYGLITLCTRNWKLKILSAHVWFIRHVCSYYHTKSSPSPKSGCIMHILK